MLAFIVAIGCERAGRPVPAAATKDLGKSNHRYEEAKVVTETVGQFEASTAEPITPLTLADLRTAASEGQVKIILQAKKQGLDLATPDEEGRTALMLAAFNGHTEAVELLLVDKRNLNAKDVSARTALMYAASGPNRTTVKFLLEAGAEVNAADNVERFTALMFAAAEGQTEICRLLLQHNANPDATDIDGDTALSFAQKNGHTGVVKLLDR